MPELSIVILIADCLVSSTNTLVDKKKYKRFVSVSVNDRAHDSEVHNCRLMQSAN